MSNCLEGSIGRQRLQNKTKTTYLGQNEKQNPLLDVASALAGGVNKANAQGNLAFGGPGFGGTSSPPPPSQGGMQAGNFNPAQNQKPASMGGGQPSVSQQGGNTMGATPKTATAGGGPVTNPGVPGGPGGVQNPGVPGGPPPPPAAPPAGSIVTGGGAPPPTGGTLPPAPAAAAVVPRAGYAEFMAKNAPVSQWQKGYEDAYTKAYRDTYGKAPTDVGTWSGPVGLTPEQAAQAMMSSTNAYGGNTTQAFTTSHNAPQAKLESYANYIKKNGGTFDPNFVSSGKWDKLVDERAAAARTAKNPGVVAGGVVVPDTKKPGTPGATV